MSGLTGQLNGKRVLLVGTGAMGRATARLALGAGAAVTLAGRDPDRLAAAAAALGVSTAVGDVEMPEQAVTLLDADPPFNHVAVLAGSSGARASSVLDTSLADAQAAYGRLWGSYNVLQAAARSLAPQGSVTLLSGSSSRRPVAGLAVWGALHGAIEAPARGAALSCPRSGSTSSAPVASASAWTASSPPTKDGEDIAAAAVALMANPAITAALLDVDGGERLGTINQTS